MLRKKISRVFRILFNSDERFIYFALKGKYNDMPDKEYISRMYKAKFGREINLDNPETFNEKLQWLKLYDRKTIYTTMVDKYEAKKYVADIIGEEYIIPTLGVWDTAEEIDFKILPDKFVLKTTHDSGGVKLVDKNKPDYNERELRKFFRKRLKRSLYKLTREWPYKDVKPRIIAEKYMENVGEDGVKDYKFFCFDGVAKCYKVDFDRFIEHHANYYDIESNYMNLGEVAFPASKSKHADISQADIDTMIFISQQLAQTTPFLRVDFYDIEGKIYWGELTFFPASGFGKLYPDEADLTLGKWIQLPVCGGVVTLIDKEVLIYFKPHEYQDDKFQGIRLVDYKFFTFNGRPKLFMVNYDRGESTKADYFDINLNKLDFTWGYPQSDYSFRVPVNYEKMLQFAEKLSVGTKELRVDFYECGNRLYFGELTFFDGSGFTPMVPMEWDYKLGNNIDLNGTGK